MSFLVTRTVAPTFAPLSDDEIAQWCRIDGDTDALSIALLLNSAIETVEGMSGQVLCQSTFNITYNYLDCSYPVPLFPLSADGLGALTIGGELQPCTFYASAGLILLTDFPTDLPTLTITAGYASPDAIPTSLKHSVAALISAGYDGREGLTDDVKGRVSNLIQPHRRMRL